MRILASIVLISATNFAVAGPVCSTTGQVSSECVAKVDFCGSLAAAIIGVTNSRTNGISQQNSYKNAILGFVVSINPKFPPRFSFEYFDYAIKDVVNDIYENDDSYKMYDDLIQQGGNKAVVSITDGCLSSPKIDPSSYP
ncbi:hypothetical protein [Labrys neptuniae]